MRFLKPLPRGAAAFCAGFLLPCLAAYGQAASAGHPSLELRSPAQMSADDTALVQAKQTEIATEAAFFGYTLSAGSWNYKQVLCPELPGYILLHYRQISRRGAESLFTALVPRAAGRVQVVPVLYRNATPYEGAPSGRRTIAVFNRVLPAETAVSTADEQGDWIEVAMTFAAVAGAEPGLVMSADAEPALYRAPHPTAEISTTDHLHLVRFTDREDRGLYSVWEVSLDNRGRVVAADDELHLTPPSDAQVPTETETASAPAPAAITPEPPQPENPAVAAPATAPSLAAQPAAAPAQPVATAPAESAAPAEPVPAAAQPIAAESTPTRPAPIGKLVPPAPERKWQPIPETPPRKEIPIPPRRPVKETPVPEQ